jgi:hypothetical protein
VIWTIKEKVDDDNDDDYDNDDYDDDKLLSQCVQRSRNLLP